MDVMRWLVDSDPAIRWQVLRDLGDAAPSAIAEERARVAHEGIGATLLARQDRDGVWRADDEPDWAATLIAMRALQLTGVDPSDPIVATAMQRLGDGFRWHDSLGGKSFFEGETEPCINGGALATGAYVGRSSTALVERLIGEQLPDGGWNCDAPKSQVSSFHSTICVLEGLLEHERATSSSLGDVRQRGEQYLLDRSLFRRRSTGEVASPSFVELHVPTRYHYDVLRGLDYLRAAGVAPSEQMQDAIDHIVARRQPDGRWLVDAGSDDHGVLGEAVGEPSRWITLRALRVLRWFDGRA